MGKVALLLACLVAAFRFASSTYAATWYVSTEGSDFNPGTAEAPFRTIQKAADIAGPGGTVIVRDGTYSERGAFGRGSKLVVVSHSGTPDNWITFTAEHKWGAVLDGLDNTTAEAWAIGGNYIRVQDFEVRGFSDAGFENSLGGQHIDIVGNHIHHIGRRCTDAKQGQDAIFLSSSNVLIERNLIHDIGRFAPGENGCAPETNYYQNHDHGIYIDGSEHGADNIMIRNNVIYNCLRGWAVQVYPAAVHNLSILNNTIAFQNPWRAGQILLAASALDSRIQNNLFYQPNDAAVRLDEESISSTAVIANNMTFPGAVAIFAGRLSNALPPGIPAIGNLSADSNVLPRAAENDFRLAASSPAVDAGMALDDVLDDFDGRPRPQGSAYDIGAYEYCGCLDEDIDRRPPDCAETSCR